MPSMPEDEPDACNTPVEPKRSGLARDVIWTTATAGLVLVGNALLASMLARRGVSTVFEPYNLVKRIGATLLPLLSLGLTLGIAKHVAATRDDNERRTFVVAAVAMALACIAIGSALLAATAPWTAGLLFGESDPRLLWTTWAYAVALTLNALVYAMFRGEMRQTQANATTLIAMVVVPLATVAAAPRGTDAITLLWLVTAWIVAWNGSQLAIRVLKGLRGITRTSFRRAVSVLGAYSIPRIPAGFAMAALLAIGPLLARRAGETEASAYLLAGLMVAQLAIASLQAFGVVLLPRVSEMHALGDHESIAKVAERMLFVALCLSAVATPAIIAVAPDLVPLWLGSDMIPSVGTVEVVALSVASVVAFSVMTSVTDAAIRRPINTYAALAGLMLGVALMLPMPADRPELLAAGYVAGQTLAAGVVVSALWRKYRIHFSVKYLVLVAGATSGMEWGLRAAAMPAAVSVLAVVLSAFIALVLALWFAPTTFGLRAPIRALAGGWMR